MEMASNKPWGLPHVCSIADLNQESDAKSVFRGFFKSHVINRMLEMTESNSLD